MKILHLLEEFCDHAEYMLGYSKLTARRYRQGLRLFCSMTGAVMVHEMTEDLVRRFFLHGRTKRAWSAGTFVTYHKNLIVFGRWLVQRGYLAHNPAESVELPKLPKSLPKSISLDDAQRVLETTRHYPWPDEFDGPRNHAMLACVVHAGLRKGELLALGLADVDLERRTLFVRRGKGGKDRFVPISCTLAEILRRYEAERTSRRKTCPGYFASTRNNSRLSETTLRRVVKRVRDASGVAFSLHILRHTFATLLLEGGCDIYSLSRMLGHSNIQTTTIYLSASAQHLRRQINKHPLL